MRLYVALCVSMWLYVALCVSMWLYVALCAQVVTCHRRGGGSVPFSHPRSSRGEQAGVVHCLAALPTERSSSRSTLERRVE